MTSCDTINFMTATSHAVLGAIIAAKIANPIFAIPIALSTHILADAFPHWDTATNVSKKGKKRALIEAFFDVLLGFGLSFLLLSVLFPYTNLMYAFIIIFASQSLDWITAPYYFFRINLPPSVWSYKLQKLIENRQKEPWGIINQIAIVSLIVVIAKII